MLSITEVEEVRDTVNQCAELVDGMSALLNEYGYDGKDGLLNVARQLYALGAELSKKMQEREGESN